MIKKTKDPGFGYNSDKNAKRIINMDGSSNVIHTNRKHNADDLYTFFVEISWFHFFLLIISIFVIINIIFGFIYTFIGIEEITPTSGNFFSDLMNGFFFSAQTLTTVGYGGIAPHGLTSNIIAAFEAMIGLLSFSFITGLLYGRFSKPKASILFSQNLILRDFKNHRALMFRLMNSKKTIMIEPEISVTLTISDKDSSGAYKRDFYKLKLERDKIMYLPTIWTIVHEIGDQSPLFNYSDDEILNLNAEINLLVQYHEESFSQKVYQIHSYEFKSLISGHRYVPSFNFDQEGYTVLDHDLLSEVTKM